jgi:hypothetical protein
MEFQCRVIVQRRCPPAARLWKTFRSKPNAIPVDDKNCSSSHRNRVHLQTGILFGIKTEWCSASNRNRVHLRPDSPLVAERQFHKVQGYREIPALLTSMANTISKKGVVEAVRVA